MESTFAVVPVKPFPEAKSRLASQVGPAQRAELAARLARRVIRAARDGGLAVLVVTCDPEARIIAAEEGAEIIDETGGRGLNRAFAIGLEAAEARGGVAALLLHADLPHVTAADVRLSAIRPGASGVTLAPAEHDGGTNAMCLPLPAPIAPAYGEDSFRRHMARVRASGSPVRVVRRTGLAVDVDRPTDMSA